MTYFIYTFTGALCTYFSCVNLLPDKLKKRQELTILFYSFSALFILNRLIGQYGTFIVLSGNIFLLYLFTNKKLLSISCYLLGYLYTVTTNYLFQWGAEKILSVDIKTLVATDQILIWFSIIFCIYCGISTKIIGHYLRKIKIADFMKSKQMLIDTLVFLFSLVIIFIFIFSYGERLGYNHDVVALTGIIFILLFLAVIRLMYTTAKTARAAAIIGEKTKLQLAEMEHYSNIASNSEQYTNNIRSITHDYDNILIGLESYMANNDMAGMIKYYENNYKPLNKELRADIKNLRLSLINNTAIRGLIITKLAEAEGRRLHTNAELIEPINDLFMEPFDLLRILGNLLDNAIDAAEQTKEKELHFIMFYRDQNLITIIKNSTLPLPFSTDIFYELNKSSKGDGRGIGLNNVTDILKNHPNVKLIFDYKESCFYQKLIIRKIEV